MASPEDIRSMLESSLDLQEEKRDQAYNSSRALIRNCRKQISELLSGGKPDEETLLKGSRALMEYLDGSAWSKSFILDALTEVAEAVLLKRTLYSEVLPLPKDIGLPASSYALGACDAVGEMRRAVLNSLIDGRLDEARKRYENMKRLFGLVEGLTYPGGMIPLKRKQDVARALIDRTLGELAVAKSIKGALTDKEVPI